MNEFSQEQHEHAMQVIDKFRTLAYPKYKKGAIEHRGNLWEQDPRVLAREVRDETIDQFVYIHDLIGWVDKLVERITKLEAENKELRNNRGL